MFTKVAFVFVVALFGCASAQIISQKGCPSNIDVQCNFDVAGYLGIWYEYAKYPTNFEVNGTCISAQYTLQDDGNVGVLNTLVNSYTGEVETINGYAQPVENGKLLVVFPGQPQLPGIKSNYWVLETDYTSYSVVYSCTPVPGLPIGSGTIVWILTRERQPTDSTLANAYNVINKYGLSTSALIQTDQSNCDVAGCP